MIYTNTKVIWVVADMATTGGVRIERKEWHLCKLVQSGGTCARKRWHGWHERKSLFLNTVSRRLDDPASNTSYFLTPLVDDADTSRLRALLTAHVIRLCSFGVKLNPPGRVGD